MEPAPVQICNWIRAIGDETMFAPIKGGIEMSNPTAAVDHSQVAAKHRAMWASGDYAKLAAELVSPLGPVLVQATGIGAG